MTADKLFNEWGYRATHRPPGNSFIYQSHEAPCLSPSSGRYDSTLRTDPQEGYKAAILAGWMATGLHAWKDDPSKATVITANWLWMASLCPSSLKQWDRLRWQDSWWQRLREWGKAEEHHPWAQNSHSAPTAQPEDNRNPAEVTRTL